MNFRRFSRAQTNRTFPAFPRTVRRGTILYRGWKQLCPNCGKHSIFARNLTLRDRCPGCGLRPEVGEGFFLGSMALSYGVTVLLFLLPVFLLTVLGVLPWKAAIIVAVAGSILFPIAFYRASRSWWLAIYYFVLVQELPANRGKLPPGEDEHV